MQDPQSKGWRRERAAVWILSCLLLLAAEPAKQDGSLSNGAQAPTEEKGGQPKGGTDGDDTAVFAESLRRGFRELGATLEKTRAQLEQTKNELQLQRADNEKLKAELEEKVGAIKAVTESLALSQTEMELFRRKYEEQRLRLQALGGQIGGEGADFDRKFADLAQALEMSESERTQLCAQLKRTVEIAEALLPVKTEGAQGEKARAMISAELARAKQFATGVSDGQEISGGTGQGSLQEARVVRVNAELQMIVLDIGRAQGVQLGMPFVVVRGDRMVAQVLVVDVREKICGAVIGEKQKTPEVGDRAKIQRSAP